MLGKLLKYDLWNVSKLLLPVHIGVVILTLIEELILSLDQVTDYFSNSFIVLVTCAYSIYLLAAVVLTVIFIIYHFYKSFYSDHGYLTFTLPVKTTTLLISKTITALIWGTINLIVIGGCILLLLYKVRPYPVDEMFYSLLRLWEYSDSLYTFFLVQIPTMLILFLIALLLMYSRFYMCFTLGQMFGSHRFAFGLLTWFALNIIRQVIFFVSEIAVFSTSSGQFWMMRINRIDTIEDTIRLVYGMELLSGFFMLLFAAAYWIITANLMKHKLNLA